MKNNSIYKIIFIGLLQISTIEYADLSGRVYNNKIKTIENMLDGSTPLDIDFVRSNLELLRNRTTSSDRVKRINKAYIRFSRFLENQEAAARAANIDAQKNNNTPNPVLPPALLPLPAEAAQEPVQPNNVQRNDVVPPTPAPARVVEIETPRDRMPVLNVAHARIETLLLYIHSLASTADVAIIVGQKRNAQDALEHAKSRIFTIRIILAQHPQLTPFFEDRVQAISNRINKTMEEVTVMH